MWLMWLWVAIQLTCIVALHVMISYSNKTKHKTYSILAIIRLTHYQNFDQILLLTWGQEYFAAETVIVIVLSCCILSLFWNMNTCWSDCVPAHLLQSQPPSKTCKFIFDMDCVYRCYLLVNISCITTKLKITVHKYQKLCHCYSLSGFFFWVLLSAPPFFQWMFHLPVHNTFQTLLYGSKHTEVKNKCSLLSTMCTFSAFVAFNKATNGQTDIKHEMRKKRSWMSLFKIADPNSNLDLCERGSFSSATHFMFYMFVTLLKATYAKNVHIVLSSWY